MWIGQEDKGPQEVTDAEYISHIAGLRPKVMARVMSWPDSVICVEDAKTIEAAWGPRRVSGRKRGMDISAYPPAVWAHKSLWITWLSRPIDHVQIVIAKKKAQARIDAALGRMAADPEMATHEPVAAITDEEVQDMIAERNELRAARMFADADKIRDYLIAQGVVVSDGRVSA